MTAARDPGGAADLHCRACRYFCGTPAEIERLCPGLTAMGSGYASVRGQDGICARHDVYVIGGDCCSAFTERAHIQHDIKAE